MLGGDINMNPRCTSHVCFSFVFSFVSLFEFPNLSWYPTCLYCLLYCSGNEDRIAWEVLHRLQYCTYSGHNNCEKDEPGVTKIENLIPLLRLHVMFVVPVL